MDEHDPLAFATLAPVETKSVDEAVVLLHGLAGSSRWWRRIVPLLADCFDVHSVDLPRDYTVATAPDLVLRRLDENGLDRPHLVGHSLGGLIAARVAAQAPERVGRLVLIAPAGIGLPPSPRAFVVPLARTLARTRPRLALTIAADALRAGPVRVLEASRALLADAALREELRRVSAPTLLIWGKRDRLVPPEIAEDFLAGLADACLHVVPRAGHVPMYDEPGEVADAIIAHLKERVDRRQ